MSASTRNTLVTVLVSVVLSVLGTTVTASFFAGGIDSRINALEKTQEEPKKINDRVSNIEIDFRDRVARNEAELARLRTEMSRNYQELLDIKGDLKEMRRDLQDIRAFLLPRGDK